MAEVREATHGLVSATRLPRIGPVHGSPPKELWHYTTNCPIQIGPRQAILSATIEQSFRPGQDFLNGCDLIPFEDYRRIDTSRAIQVSRTEIVANPNAGGKKAMLTKGPCWGGFIPFGAKRKDGTPHPHAGTGFGWNIVGAWPTDDSDLVNEVQRKGRRQIQGPEAYQFLETYQFAYDGKTFRIVSREKRNYEEWVPGWNYVSEGFSTGVPDGDDLLLPTTMARPGGPYGCGIVRWKRSGERWSAVSFQQITPNDSSTEPTLVRDIDGEFLFCARAKNADGHPMRVWKSSEQGNKWDLIVFVGGIFKRSHHSAQGCGRHTVYCSQSLPISDACERAGQRSLFPDARWETTAGRRHARDHDALAD